MVTDRHPPRGDRGACFLKSDFSASVRDLVSLQLQFLFEKFGATILDYEDAARSNARRLNRGPTPHTRDTLMSHKCRSRRPWFLRPFMLFEKVSDRCARCVRPKKASLRLLNLEDRITPTNSLSILKLDDIGYLSKTVAIRLQHEGAGTPTASLDWGDGTTVSLSSWSYATSEKVLTHEYASTGDFTVSVTDSNISKSDSEELSIFLDVPLEMPVDGGHGLEWGKTASPNGNNPSNISPGQVRYIDGVASLSFPDLSSSGYGMPFGHTRSWTNGPGYDAGGDNGNGWVEVNLPSLVAVEDDKIFALAIDGTNARTFAGDSPYIESFSGQNKLVHDGDNDKFVLTTPDGVVYEFLDFTVTDVASRGQFQSRTDPNGNVTEVTDRDAAGNVAEITRDGGSEVWTYEYYDAGDNIGKLQRVTLNRSGELRKVEYAYYGGEAYGNRGDLKMVTVMTPSDATISTSYYRYYMPGEEGGYTGGLKMAVCLASFDRATEALTDATTASDNDLKAFADFYFEYDDSHRVALQRVQGLGCSMCSAGIGEYSFEYASSANSPGFNAWAVRTYETLPDGNSNVVYSNAYGQVMLKVAQEGSADSPTLQWPTFYRYDEAGRIVLQANPSAFVPPDLKLYDDSNADLVEIGGEGSPYLSDSIGLITTYQYGDGTSATDTTPGEVTGYLKQISIQQGEDGTPMPQVTYEYLEITSGDITIHPRVTHTIYRNDDSTGGQTTAYDYDFDDLMITQITITYPTVVEAQNGPDSADTVAMKFDVFGRAVWSIDGAGHISYREYDDATGAVTLQISDVNTVQWEIDYDPATAPWINADGLHLVTMADVDFLGRTTKATDANGHVTYTFYDDPNHEMRVYPGWDSIGYTTTGPIQVYREDWARKYRESLTMAPASISYDSHVPLGDDSITELRSLSRTILNDAGQAIEQDNYFDLSELTYGAETVTLLNVRDETVHYAILTDYAAARRREAHRDTDRHDHPVHSRCGESRHRSMDRYRR